MGARQVSHLQWSHMGHMLLTASKDGTARLWHPLRQPRKQKNSSQVVNGPAVSPSRRIAGRVLSETLLL